MQTCLSGRASLYAYSLVIRKRGFGFRPCTQRGFGFWPFRAVFSAWMDRGRTLVLSMAKTRTRKCDDGKNPNPRAADGRFANPESAIGSLCRHRPASARRPTRASARSGCRHPGRRVYASWSRKLVPSPLPSTLKFSRIVAPRSLAVARRPRSVPGAASEGDHASSGTSSRVWSVPR